MLTGAFSLCADIAPCPKVTSAGKHHKSQPQPLRSQVLWLSDLDLGQTVTLPVTREQAQPSCPSTSGGVPEAVDVVANGKLLIMR